MKTSVIVILCLYCFVAIAQPYKNKNANRRYSFAQTVFGIETQISGGGKSAFINEKREIEQFTFAPHLFPRICIAGIHFWGHAEFYFALPLPKISSGKYKNVKYDFSVADIFGTKVFPWAIQKRKIRPYFGFTLSGINYHQYTNTGDGLGLKHTQIKLPLLAGLNYCTGKYLIEAGINYNYDNGINYYISPTQRINISSPTFFINLTFKRWFETTTPAPKHDSLTKIHYDVLRKKKRLSSWFIGIGPSSSFYVRTSSYNKDLKPYMQKPFSAAVFPEIVSGYYIEPVGIHLVAVFRTNNVKNKAYGTTQKLKRTSLAIEVHKQLFDYNGFVPYVGAALSYEWLQFNEEDIDGNSIKKRGQQIAPGAIFGWDILPDKLQGFTLRTNLRYFPNLALDVKDGKEIIFDQVEFNFIQLVIYPQRIRAIRKVTEND